MGGFMNFRLYFYKGKTFDIRGKIPVFYNLVVKKKISRSLFSYNYV